MLGFDWLDALELVAAVCHSICCLVLLLLLLLLLNLLGFFLHFLHLLSYFLCLYFRLLNGLLFLNHKCFRYILPFHFLFFLYLLWLFHLILFLTFPIVLDRKHFIILNAILEQLHSFFFVKDYLCCPFWRFCKRYKFSNIRWQSLTQRIVELRIALILMKAKDVIDELKAFISVLLKRQCRHH